MRLIAEARALGGPYVFRLNLNQQSSGPTWEVHKALMQTTSPIVDCGVHYVDVMCQITDAKPRSRCAAWACACRTRSRPTCTITAISRCCSTTARWGWYEAGWGPMMSDTAFFVKDVVAPTARFRSGCRKAPSRTTIDTHTKTSTIRVHRVGQPDQDLSMADEPGHQDLCDARAGLHGPRDPEDIDLTRHMEDAVQSLAICLAADESVRSGQPVKL
jgi:predicted dehydrogenase